MTHVKGPIIEELSQHHSPIRGDESMIPAMM
jgi:hypothetical protein